MTLAEHAEAYASAYPDRPRMQVVREGIGRERHDVLYGTARTRGERSGASRWCGPRTIGCAW